MIRFQIFMFKVFVVGVSGYSSDRCFFTHAQYHWNQSKFLNDATKNRPKERNYDEISLICKKIYDPHRDYLVGGFNPFEKYARQNGFIFPI